MCSAVRPDVGTMGCVTASAVEYALADLAIRLGAAQVPGLSRAEQDLAAAAATMEAGGGANWPGPARWDGCTFWDFRDDGAGRDYGGGGDGVAELRVGVAGLRVGVAGLRARIRAGEDPLGQAFCRIRPPEQRRGAGQTFIRR